MMYDTVLSEPLFQVESVAAGCYIFQTKNKSAHYTTIIKNIIFEVCTYNEY